jgi:hypothetical protein
MQRLFDRATLAAMAAGLGILLLPGVEGALAAGFFVTLGATLAQIAVSHLRPKAE